MVFENIPKTTIIVLAFIFFILFAIGLSFSIWFMRKLKWPFSVWILEDLNGSGNYLVTRRDRARIVGLGDSGEEVFYLKKARRYKIGYGKYIAPRGIAWAIGSDGYFYNVTIGDLNKKLMQMGINPIDRNVRLANSAARELVKNTYKAKKGLEAWLVPIGIGLILITIIIAAVSNYQVLKKQNEITMANAEATKASAEIVTNVNQLLSRYNNILNGGSGIVQEPVP